MTVSLPEQFNMAARFLDYRIKEGLEEKVAVYYKGPACACRGAEEMANRRGNALVSPGVEMEGRALMAATLSLPGHSSNSALLAK